MLTRFTQVKDDMIFRIPFSHSCDWHTFKEDYPKILELDGSDETCTLEFYYSLNPINNSYEFLSENEENDIAELIGICFDIVQTSETKEEKIARTEKEKEECEVKKKETKRSLDAFMYIAEEEERNAFLDSDLTIEDYLRLTNDNSARSIATDFSNEDKSVKTKKEITAAKKERRRKKLEERAQKF